MFYTRDCLQYGAFDCISNSHIFEKDNAIYREMRKYIKNFLTTTIANHKNQLILEVGPPNFEATTELSEANIVETVDIAPNSKTTYVADLTNTNAIP